MVTKIAKSKDYKKQVDDLIKNLSEMSASDAKKQALDNLKKIGVLDKSGKTKSQIVNGDFFGW